MNLKKSFKGDIIIVAPESVVKSEEDWQHCKWGENMESLGFENCICFDEGDEYGSKVINTDTNEVIGSFCTDSSYLVIMYFEDLMNYNPNFSDHIEWPDSNTIIKNFDGEIEVVADRQKGEFYIIGKGNINFKTEND